MISKIGLEVHGYLTTAEKLFCRCPTNYKAARPNSNICPVCCGMPGSKPMLPNVEALKKCIAIALMLGCKINKEVLWQRKHYDWPDLPKGYQDTISGAYSIPVAESGSFLDIAIKECHLEEDPARWDPLTGRIDYNRCGMPLIEIVTAPEFSSSKQVREWLNQLLILLGYIKAVDPDAGIKADINISVAVDGRQGSRIEIKNLNSITEIEKAIDYEILRQSSLLKTGKKVEKETLTWNAAERVTVTMRAKEEAEEYRFIPDPDLPALNIAPELVAAIKARLPELPHLKAQRFVQQYRIDKKTASVLASNLELADFFERVAKAVSARLAAYWCSIELLRILNWNKKQLHEVSIKPEHFIELLQLVEQKKLTELKAKQLLNSFVPKSFSVKAQIGVLSLDEVEKICKEIIKAHPQAIKDFRAGEEKALHFLIGKVVEASQRRADSRLVKEILIKLIK